MSLKKRYTGGFFSLSGTAWEVEIWQESGLSFEVCEVAFTSEPLTIEWSETDKIEPVQASKATLTLYSDTDRQFIDLYTVAAGSVRLDVYRNGVLYWSGTLDPELYEEPYSWLDNYAVALTFSDLAVLDRLNWGETGFKTLREVILKCIEHSGVRHNGLKEYISTTTTAYSVSSLLDDVSLIMDNFYDEDGQAMSVREVLDETLRPFALRLVQKAGEINLYDLNAVYTSFNTVPVNWSSDDSLLSVDKTYNNVTVSFSPYEQFELLKGEVDIESVPTNEQNLPVRVDYSKTATGAFASPVGFYIALSDTGEGVSKAAGTKFFRIQPVYSGSEKAGVAWTVQTMPVSGSYTSHIKNATHQIGDALYEASRKAYLPDTGYDNRANYLLRLNVELLFDVRYNPYEAAARENEEGNWERLINWCNLSYIPVILTLRNADGTALYHYENKLVFDSSGYDSTNKARWVQGEGAYGDAYLCYYNPSNRRSDTGLGDWKTNKQTIGFYQDGYLPVLYLKRGDGEYISLPPVTGWLELKVGAGVICYDHNREIKDIYSRTHWVLYGKSDITLTDKYGKIIEKTDLEHKAWINPAAKESMQIDTIVGTLKKASPCALGQAFRTADKTVISTFFRASRQDMLERLLIATIYSNYVGRNTILSGTCDLLPAFGTYTDANQPGSYLLLSETQNLREDESKIVMSLFHEDSYEGVEYE
jgi:hypothetical protein